MPRPKKETHLFFEQGDDEIQIRSWDKDFNAAVRKQKEKYPDTVWIRANDDEEPGFLWGAVKLVNFLFYPHPAANGEKQTGANRKRQAPRRQSEKQQTKMSKENRSFHKNLT